MNWIVIGAAPQSEAMEPVEVDLSDFSGRVIWLRFVFEGGAAADGIRPDVWRLDDIQIQREASGLPYVAPSFSSASGRVPLL
jgi:hypothetical protein